MCTLDVNETTSVQKRCGCIKGDNALKGFSKVVVMITF